MSETTEPRGQWRPIETAPKTGEWVLLAGGHCEGDAGNNHRRPVVAQWTTYLNARTGPQHGRWQFAWYDGGYCGEYRVPTHWMPLPAPPMAKTMSTEAPQMLKLSVALSDADMRALAEYIDHCRARACLTTLPKPA